jgi:hypothetical protein
MKKEFNKNNLFGAGVVIYRITKLSIKSPLYEIWRFYLIFISCRLINYFKKAKFIPNIYLKFCLIIVFFKLR